MRDALLVWQVAFVALWVLCLLLSFVLPAGGGREAAELGRLVGMGGLFGTLAVSSLREGVRWRAALMALGLLVAVTLLVGRLAGT